MMMMMMILQKYKISKKENPKKKLSNLSITNYMCISQLIWCKIGNDGHVMLNALMLLFTFVRFGFRFFDI